MKLSLLYVIVLKNCWRVCVSECMVEGCVYWMCKAKKMNKIWIIKI